MDGGSMGQRTKLITLKTSLNYILSLSLVLTPYSVLATSSSSQQSLDAESSIEPSSESSIEPSSESSIESFLDQLTKNPSLDTNNPEVQRAIQVINDLHQDIMTGNLSQEENSEVSKEFDTLRLSNQVATVYDAHGNVSGVIPFDSEGHVNNNSSEKILSIEVTFESGLLTFIGVSIQGEEGQEKNVIEKHVSVIQTIKNINEKNVLEKYVYDKEILAILYQTKGGIELILYHMNYATELIGRAPIPSTSFYLEESDLPEKLELKFVSQENPIRNLNLDKYPIRNSDGQSLLQAGDLIIYSEETKNFSMLITRENIYERIKEMYESLNLLLEISNSSNTLERLLEISREQKDIKAHSPEQLMYDLINRVTNRNALYFLDRYRNSITGIVHLLDTSTNEQERNIFIPKQGSENKPTDEKKPEENKRKIKSFVSKPMDFFKYIKYLYRKDLAHKGKKDLLTFEQWKEKKTEGKQSEGFIKEHKLELAVATIGAAAAVWYFSTLKGLDNSPSSDVLQNMILLGAGVLGLLYGVTAIFIPLLKGIDKLIPPELKSFKPFKHSLRKTIEKWQGKDKKTLITGLGFKLVAVLLPLFHRLSQLGGVPSVFNALTRGVNFKSAIATIESGSDLGKKLGLTKNMNLFGVRNQDKKTVAVDLMSQRDQRVEHVARLMAMRAMLGHSHFDASARFLGTLNLDLEKLIKNPNFVSDFQWISQTLGTHILESKQINAFQGLLQWDQESLNDFYKRAQELYKKSQTIPRAQKIGKNTWENTKHFVFQKVFNWNSAQAERLNNMIPSHTIANQFHLGLIIDHITMVMLPLTLATPRGADGILSGVDTNLFFNSSRPHLFEAIMNIAAHVLATGRQQLVDLNALNIERLRTLLQTQKADNKFQSTQQEEKISVPTFWFSSLKFPFQLGTKIREGSRFEEKVDIGSYLWKLLTTSYRFWGVSLVFLFTGRQFLTASGVDMNILGALYFLVGGIIYFGWPQMWSLMHNQSLSKRLQFNKENIELIRFVEHKLEKNLYSNRQQGIDQDFQRVITAFRSLYRTFNQIYSTTVSRKLFRTDHKGTILDSLRKGIDPSVFKPLHTLLNTNDTKEAKKITQDLNKLLDTKQQEELIKIISDIVQNNPGDKNPNSKYFPTAENNVALSSHLLLTLGIFSNLAFVYLSTDSFNQAQVNITNILQLFFATLGGILSYKLITSKSLPNHKENIQRYYDRLAGPKIKNILFSGNPIQQEIVIIDALRKAGIITMRQLRKLTTEELLAIPDIGQKRVQIIRERMAGIPSSNSKFHFIRDGVNKCKAVLRRINNTTNE